MSSRNIFILFIAAEIAIGIVAIIVDDISIEALHTATRFSGRLSLLFFSLILLVKDKTAGSDRIISVNPYLLFSILHGIHLAELLAFVSLSGIVLIPYRVLGGFAAYLFIFIIPYLAHLHRKGKLSAVKFQKTEAVFLLYIWFIFFMSYLPRVLGKLPDVGGTFTEHITLFAWVILVGALRLSWRLKLIPVIKV
jgi:hypothetical protein